MAGKRMMNSCPKCGCMDLRVMHVDKEDNCWASPFWGGKSFEVSQCFKCGWREESPWEAGKRMARESFAKLNLNLEKIK